MPPVVNALQVAFFDYVFGEDVPGYVCIATSTPKSKSTFKQHFFAWPSDKEKMLAFVADASAGKFNVWFCVNLLSKEERKKEYCLPHNLVWADLDTCDPATVEPEPQCIIQTSPGRYQAIWRIEETLDPHHASHLAKRLAYAYSSAGADKSGHDLTQLLRVPFSLNYKYVDEVQGAPVVKLERAYEALLPVDLFDALPEVERALDDDYQEMPVITALPAADDTILKYWPGLHRTPFSTLYSEEPDGDWSRVLWRIINLCFEAGMSANEVFAVALSSKCNKYARDNRPITHLWQEVRRAEKAQRALAHLTGQYDPLTMPTLVTNEEIKKLEPTFAEDYVTWATEATDACPDYHELSAFMLLSMLGSAGMKLATSYGVMYPNLWGMVLGDSTLTRKTTAMKLALSFVDEVDRDLLLASDGSAEGLMTGLASRSEMVSIYFRDELAGLFDSMARKDYMAGMAEMFTQLYDVPPFYARKLRKETITVSLPVFIFFGGGIRDKMYTHINESMILSGFIPRFLVVSGDAEMSRIRPTGPATMQGTEKRDELLKRLRKFHANYTKTAEIELAGQTTTIPSTVEVFLDNEAWERYAEIEVQMIEAAQASSLSMLALPCFERLSRSILKMSMLVAAMRNDPDNNTIQVLSDDVAVAAKYGQRWGQHTIDLLLNSGRSTTQRLLDNILTYIRQHPGVSRGRLMQVYRLTRREMDEVQSTLEDRGEIKITRSGKTVIFEIAHM